MRRRSSLGFGVVGALGAGALRAWYVRWGATPDEEHATLPGDLLLRSPTTVTTRAVTVHAPPSAIWPWLVQMGQDRAGLYSYDRLERLCRLGFRNSDRIEPAWQHLAVGDQIRAAPASAGAEAGFTVVAIVPERAIVTAVGDPERVVPQAESGELPDGATWVFVLRPSPGGTTRLVIRFRSRFGMASPAAEWLAARLLEPVHFVMERKMLLGIKQRAESFAASSPDVAEEALAQEAS